VLAHERKGKDIANICSRVGQRMAIAGHPDGYRDRGFDLFAAQRPSAKRSLSADLMLFTYCLFFIGVHELATLGLVTFYQEKRTSQPAAIERDDA